MVDLLDEEQSELEESVSKGKHRTGAINCAKILLKADDELTDFRICELVG